MDKKIKELMKVCTVFELPTPNDTQISSIFSQLIPEFDANPTLKTQMVQYTQGDIRKAEFLLRLHEKKPEALTGDNIQHIFRAKFYNEDYGRIAKQLFDTRLSVGQHADFMNDNDRTTVALLWHENVVDRLEEVLPLETALPFYLKLVDNICFADYIDRITFQNQIWIFNEMSTFIKTFHNNYLFHRFFERRDPAELETIRAMREVRFTKILTKYSTEYSNQLFLYMLCQVLDMGKNDVIAFFQELRIYYGGNDFLNRAELLNDAENIFEDTKIGKLDIKRIYRYLDKNVKKETASSKKTATNSGEDGDFEFEIDDDDDDEGME
jgi:hypothetical protein